MATSSSKQQARPMLLRTKSFWLLAAVSLLGYWLIYAFFPLIPHYNRLPLSDIRSFTPSLTAAFGYVLLLVGLYALYGFGYQQIRRQRVTVHLSQILITTAVFALPLLYTYPINANDLYRYYIRGRISSVYQSSPYTTAPDALATDPYLPLAGEWANATSPYGPLWELTAAGLTRLAPDNLLLGMVLFKLLGAVAHGATAVFIWHLLAKQETAVRAALTLLWAWNPALLLFFIADAHNDALMIFWLVAGYWLRQKRPIVGFWVMALGALTKPIGLLILPFFLLADLRQQPSWLARLSFLGKTAVGTLSIALLLFLPFGSPFALATRLLSEAGSGGGFSPLVFLVLLVRGVGGIISVSLLTQLAVAAFGLFFLWLLWQTWNGRSPLRSSADIFLAYILQALNFRIWYVTWPFVWLILDGQPRRLKFGFWLLLTAQLSVLIHGHLRAYALGGDHFWGHMIGVPFTFLLPLLLAYSRTPNVPDHVSNGRPPRSS